jgi:hypothetical protein
VVRALCAYFLPYFFLFFALFCKSSLALDEGAARAMKARGVTALAVGAIRNHMGEPRAMEAAILWLANTSAV